jgi:hypothetical protein
MGHQVDLRTTKDLLGICNVRSKVGHSSILRGALVQPAYSQHGTGACPACTLSVRNQIQLRHDDASMSVDEVLLCAFCRKLAENGAWYHDWAFTNRLPQV